MLKTKLFPFLFLLVFLADSAMAQQIRWSAPIGDDNQMRYLKIIGSDEDDFYILRSNQPFSEQKKNSKSRKYRVACYSQAMALRWEKAIAPAPDGRILDVKMVNRHLVVYSYVPSGSTLQLQLQYLTAAGDLDGKPSPVDEWPSNKMDDDNRPDLLMSNDQSLMAIAYRVGDKKESTQQYRIVVCDTTLSVLYLKEISVDPGNLDFSPVSIAISDSGNISLLGMLNVLDKKGRFTGEGHYRLYAWWKQIDKLAIHEIEKPGTWLTDAALAVDNVNNAAVVAGFYSNGQSAATAGVFYFRALADSEASGVQMSSFSDEYLKKVHGSKSGSGKELVNYSIDKMLLRRDGGAVLSAESFSTSSKSYYDYYTQMLISHTYYTYGNILSLSVNPDGTLAWSEVVNKEHNSVDDDGYLSSYCTAVYRAKMYYVYNKYIETKTSVMLTSVSSHGEQKTMVLFNELEHIIVVPKAARQIEEDVLLLPAFKENKLCIVRIGL